MNSELSIYKKFLERTKKEIIAPLKNLSEEQVNAKTSADPWSLLDLAEHLYLIESRIFSLSTKDEKEEFPKLGILDDLRIWFFGMVLLTPIKVKIPVKAVVPTESTDRDSLLADWSKLQSNWIQTLEGSGSEVSRKAIMKHPIAGFMTRKHCLLFINKHLSHHLRQISRIVEAAAKS